MEYKVLERPLMLWKRGQCCSLLCVKGSLLILGAPDSRGVGMGPSCSWARCRAEELLCSLPPSCTAGLSAMDINTAIKSIHLCSSQLALLGDGWGTVERRQPTPGSPA